MQPTRLPRKKDVAIALLEQATVYVHIDPRAAEVHVPPWFKRQPQLVLQIGLNMPVPIPDLDVSDHGLSCTLSFNRSPFHCRIPWPSVFALVGESGRGMVWPDDVPPEVAAQAQKQARPQLSAVASPAPAPAEQPAEEAKPAAKKARAQKSSKARAAKATKAPSKEPKADARKKRSTKETGARAAAQRPAAPPRAEAARRAAQPAPAREPAPAQQNVASLKAAATSGKGATGARKKRALPPYLRVVK